MLVALLSLCEM